MGLNLGKWVNGIFSITDISKSNQVYSASLIFVYGQDAVWVASHPGLARFTTAQLYSTSPFTVYITGVLLDGKKRSDSSDARFSYRQNNLNLEFSANTYLDEQAVTYSYRLLKTKEENWTEPLGVHSSTSPVWLPATIDSRLGQGCLWKME